MGDFKTCDIHDKEFPANLIDTTKHEVTKLFAEKVVTVEGKKTTLSLFIGNNENEGAESCHKCLMESLLKRLEGLGITVSWKVIKWHNEDIPRKDGNGTYSKLVKEVYTLEEYKQKLLEEKAKKEAPAPTPKAQ